MKPLYVLLAAVYISVVAIHGFDIKKKIQAYKTATAKTDQVIRSHGYPVEKHEVITSDDYILNVYRIPQSKSGNGEPILLLGSLSATTSIYAMFNHSLAFVLADKGYDVWLGNYRGIIKDSRHKKYSHFDDKFWDFSWDQLSVHDLPSMIDYILIHTDHSQLSIVSISLSTIVTTSLHATKPEYNYKVKQHVALAPVLHGRYTNSVAFVPLAHISGLLRDFYELSVATGLTTEIGSQLMFYGSILMCLFNNNLCKLTLTAINGYTPLDLGDFGAIQLAYTSEGVSLKTVIQIMQMLHHGPMAHYDYGAAKNLVKYGSVSAPLYNLSRITTPTSLFYGANDANASPLTVDIVRRQIPNSRAVLMEGAMFNHADYVASTDTTVLHNVNRKILEHLQMKE